MSQCRSCGAPVRWAPSAHGRTMPLDADPAADGNLYLDDAGVARVATESRPAPPGAALYRSHFSTCPNAARHRKEGAR